MSPAKKRRDPAAIVHVHVKPGRTVVLDADGTSYGDRSTLQVPGRVADALVKAGVADEVDSTQVPDVGAA
jgi:hypothetical protein